MGSFRRVEGEQAGAGALGILVPPARRTFVILRPRALPWDLLLCRSPAELSFRELSHDEASAAAQGLYRALRDGLVAIDPLPGAEGCRLRVQVGPFALVACPRQPGRPYAPLACPEADIAAAVGRLLGVLSPAGPEEQELYFNMRFFERPPS
jgi:hypothetical protein